MKIVILDASTLGNDIDLNVFDKIGKTVVYFSTPEDTVGERISDADVVILNKVKLNEKNLCNALNLKLICITATGFDNVDLDCARKKGIAVCNVKGYSTDSVAQLTVSLALSLVCHLTEYDSYCKSGKYTESGVQNCLYPVIYELSGKTWGLYGYGNIGKRVAEIAKALGCRVIACKRTPDTSVECVSLEELFEKSDIISLHTPLNDKTRETVNEGLLSRAKRKPVLINVARGSVVNEEDVTKAIEDGILSGFASDVYTVEPMQKSSPYNRLKDFKNVIFTPHNAWGAYESRVRLLNEIVENIKAFYSGERRNRVD